MNGPMVETNLVTQPLYAAALSVLADASAVESQRAEMQWLRSQQVLCNADCTAFLAQWMTSPSSEDALLHALSIQLHLAPAEILVVAIAAAVETDAMVGRVLSWLQAPVGGSRPTLGLVVTIAESLGIEQSLSQILNGTARTSGLLQLEGEQRPLPEVCVQVPVPLVMALQGGASQWPGVTLGLRDKIAYAESMRVAAVRQAHALSAGVRILAVRTGHPRESRMAAAFVANEFGAQAAFIENEAPKGLGPWLWLTNAMPVFCTVVGPGETKQLPELAGYSGPVLVATGPDGSFERDGDAVSNWRVPLPTASERITIWSEHVSDPDLAEMLGRTHRYGAAKIQLLGQAAHYQASLQNESALTHQHISVAARRGAAGELGTLAELQTDDIPDEALVVPTVLRESLRALLQRCRSRETLTEPLGLASRTRYRPGVRALFVGPSGTGKTLAAGWLATHLGLPLYRVDVASVSSKYIGETEKNLAQLFARAEHTEVVLLFDEADSLFGKRTDVKDANDRFANAQTNYLLQRIESFDGFAILTSNSRSRFDSAFTRRLDAIVDFPPPGPDERRALWLAHLGMHHSLDLSQINRVAASCDLAGGHIRNATLVAASLKGSAIDFDSLRRAIESEYRKLGKQMPAGL